MLHRDYLMRYVLQFTQFLLRILGLNQKRQYKEALEAIRQAVHEFLGLDFDTVLDMPESVLLSFLTLSVTAPEGRERSFMAVTLLKEAGDILTAQGYPDESTVYYLKALNLLLAVLRKAEGSTPPDYAPGVELLASRLGEYVLPCETYVALFRHYERTGAYGQAGDILLELVEIEPENRRAIEMGISFYERLRHQPDEALRAGDLSPDEVEAGLAELRSYQQGGPPGGAHDQDG